MNIRNYLMGAAVLVCVGLLSFRAGVELTRDAYGDGIYSVQAMLSLNHLNRYEEIHGCLSGGNPNAALNKLEMSIVSEKELIAEYLHSPAREAETAQYISARYPEGVEGLESFESNRGTNWSEAECN